LIWSSTGVVTGAGGARGAAAAKIAKEADG